MGKPSSISAAPPVAPRRPLTKAKPAVPINRAPVASVRAPPISALASKRKRESSVTSVSGTRLSKKASLPTLQPHLPPPPPPAAELDDSLDDMEPGSILALLQGDTLESTSKSRTSLQAPRVQLNKTASATPMTVLPKSASTMSSSTQQRVFTSESVDELIKDQKRRNLFLGQAKKQASEEKWVGDAALRSLLVNKNITSLLLRDYILNGDAGLRQAKERDAIVTTAARTADEATKVAQLSTENAQLKRQLAQVFASGNANAGATSTSPKSNSEAKILAAEQKAKMSIDAVEARAKQVQEAAENRARSAEVAAEKARKSLENEISKHAAIQEAHIKALDAANTARLKAAAESEAALETAQRKYEEREKAEKARTAAALSEVARYRALFEVADRRRMILAEDLATLRAAIRVFVRVRPFLPKEAIDAQQLLNFPDASSDATDIEVIEHPGSGIGGYGKATEGKKTLFNLQRVFPPTAQQDDLFREVEILVQSAINGCRATIFAYGQTGSGKTHTMQGTASDPGLTPQAGAYLFQRAAIMAEQGWATSIKVEVLEIYNETIRDLLQKSTASSTVPSLEIRHNKEGDPFVPGLESRTVSSPQELTTVLSQAASARATSATLMNAHSSRSHLIVTLRVLSTHSKTNQKKSGVLNLIDLAGSERLDKSGAVGDRKKEAASINTSLAALSSVIIQLQSKAKHISFRDSKLTHLLQSSLTPAISSCRTLMICAIAPGHANSSETLSTLLFAKNVAFAQSAPPRQSIMPKGEVGNRGDNS
jgi:kinesin family protein C1